MSATKVRAFDYAVWLHVSSCARSLQPQMLVQLEALHSYVLQGESECHMFTAAPGFSGGKVFKNCHHQVSLPPLPPPTAVTHYCRTVKQYISAIYAHLNTCMQVTTATKYIMKKESTRDHVDLLASSKHWPTVFAVDMACDVVAHTEARYLQLANALWGNRRACLEPPSTVHPPKVYSLVLIILLHAL